MEQYRVRSHTLPDTQVDMVKGQDMEGCGAVPPCSSRIYSFAAKHLVGGLRLPLVSGVGGRDLPGTEWRRMRIHWNPLASASLSPPLTPLIFTQRIVAAASLLLPNLMRIPPLLALLRTTRGRPF